MDSSYTSLLRLLACLFILSFTTATVAQGQDYFRNDIVVGLSTESASDVRGGRHFYSGPFGLYDYNLSSHLALEGGASYINGNQRGEYTDEGHELLVSAGIKAGWHFERFGLFGRLSPGFTSFDRGIGISQSPASPFVFSRRTHFALQGGATFEYYPSAHSIVRLDVGQTVLAEFDQVVARNPELLDRGHVAQHMSLRLGAGYRFGDRPNDSTIGIANRAPVKAQLGILYSLHIKEHLLNQDLEPDQGIGLWSNYAIGRWLGVDGTVFYLPRNDKQINFQDGGQALEAYVGVRSGIQLKRMGYFAKLRPGMAQFAHTVYRLNEAPTYSLWYDRFTNFALDMGGIVETYPASHLVLRAEAGNDLLFYRERTVSINGERSTIPGETRASLLILFGAGVRF